MALSDIISNYSKVNFYLILIQWAVVITTLVLVSFIFSRQDDMREDIDFLREAEAASSP